VREDSGVLGFLITSPRVPASFSSLRAPALDPRIFSDNQDITPVADDPPAAMVIRKNQKVREKKTKLAEHPLLIFAIENTLLLGSWSRHQ
jgi:hypothetical protein